MGDLFLELFYYALLDPLFLLPPDLGFCLASDFAIIWKSLGTINVRVSPPASLYFDFAALPFDYVSIKNGISSGAKIWMLICESLSLNRLGVRPSRPVIPLEKESITPSISVSMYS